jgi:hypothetical protein
MPGLPDGLFSSQKSQIWFIFVGLRMEHLDMFYVHFYTFKSIWCILTPFVTFCDNLVLTYFPTLVCLNDKNLATLHACMGVFILVTDSL